MTAARRHSRREVARALAVMDEWDGFSLRGEVIVALGVLGDFVRNALASSADGAYRAEWMRAALFADEERDS